MRAVEIKHRIACLLYHFDEKTNWMKLDKKERLAPKTF